MLVMSISLSLIGCKGWVLGNVFRAAKNNTLMVRIDTGNVGRPDSHVSIHDAAFKDMVIGSSCRHHTVPVESPLPYKIGVSTSHADRAYRPGHNTRSSSSHCRGTTGS